MDLTQFAAHLAGVNFKDAVKPVLSRAGGNMQRDMRAEAPVHSPIGKTHLPKYRSQLWFRRHADGVTVEAGAFGRQQGNFAAILEFGQGPNPPYPHIIPALYKEAPQTAAWAGKAVADAFRKPAP